MRLDAPQWAALLRVAGTHDRLREDEPLKLDLLELNVPTWDRRASTPFDSVENTQEYFRMLAETLLDVKRDLDGDIAAAVESQSSRRVEALRLVLFKVQKLEEHAKASSLLLNDLRSLRRLLLQERASLEGVKSK